jgi:PrtD family type I secretion system ABC transporter
MPQQGSLAKGPFGRVELQEARRRGLGLLGAVALFSAFVNLLMLTGPLFMLQVYDRVLASRSEETLVALFLLVAALYGLMGVLDYARGRVLARFGARFQAGLDSRVFAAEMKQSLQPQFRAAPASGLRDLEIIQTMFTSPAMLALFDVPWTPLFVGAIFIFHPFLGWMAISGGVLLIILTLLNNGLTRQRAKAAQTAAQQAQAFADQARLATEIVYSQGMSTTMAARWHVMRDRALDQTLRASDWTGLFTTLTKTFRLFLQSAMLAVGAWLVLRGDMTAGAMIASSILLGRALAPIEQSIGQWGMVQRSFGGWKLLSELLKTTPPAAPAMHLPKPEAHLTLKNVTIFAPAAKQPTLLQIGFELSPGQAIGIIGKSGSGKSTLAKAILGLLDSRAGEIRLGGATLDQYDPDALGAFIGYLPQQVTLFNGTVAENIARMSMAPDEAKVIAAAQQANAHEMILSLPEGYKTLVQGQDSQLSGGQRQRIAMARAFYNDPVLLVLDEPNSALDAEGSQALNRAVRDFKASNRAVVIMTHRPMAIAECDRLIVLDQGCIKADGPRDEVMQAVLRNAEDVRLALSNRLAS